VTQFPASHFPRAHQVVLGHVGSETTYHSRGWPPQHQHGSLGADENGPWGGAVPKGPLCRGLARAGIPAPQFSRRESPINRGARYLGGTRCVKAILALLKGGHAEHHGDGAVHGRGIGQVDPFDNDYYGTA